MNVLVRYLSKGGNTEYIASVIAKELNTNAISILDEPKLNKKADLLFLGCGTYFNSIDKNMKEYINNLNNKLVNTVVLFSSSFISLGAIKAMNKLLNKKDIKVMTNYYHTDSSTVKFLDDEYKAFARVVLEKANNYKEDRDILDIIDGIKEDKKKEELVQKYFEMYLEHYVFVKLRVLDPRVNNYSLYTTISKEDKDKLNKIDELNNIDKDVYEIYIGKYMSEKSKGVSISFTIYDCNNSSMAKDLMYKHNKEFREEESERDGVLY